MDSNIVSIGSPNLLYVASAAYASLPAASGYAEGTRAYATDVPCEVAVRSSRWVPIGQPLMASATMPILSPPTINANASGTANGASTFATAVTPLIQKGYMYVPANSLSASHAAGFYYFEMSSTTAFTAYNNTYTPATGVYPTEPTSKTAFSGAVPGGTGDTSERTILIKTIPAGYLWKYGTIVTDIGIECNNSAGTKVTKIYIDTQVFATESLTTSASLHGMHAISNIGNEANQRAPSRITNTSSVSASVNGAVNTATALDYKITMQKNTATDYHIVQFANVLARIPA